MVWAEADEVFWGVVLFIWVYVVEINYFVESADGALFCDFSEGFEVYIVWFSRVVGLVFVGMEDVVVAAGAEAFGVDCHFSLASFASFDFWLPVYFFVARVAEAFGVMFFFLIAVYAGFDYDS